MRHRLLSLSLLTSAAAGFGFQLVAMVALQPADYGVYSAMYLISAFGISIQLSTISEAWVRTTRLGGPLSPWSLYSGSLVWLALIAGAVGSAIAATLPFSRPFWLAVGIAVCTSVYRSGARFYSLRMRNWSKVLGGDLASFLVAVAVAVLVFTNASEQRLAVIVWGWALASVAAAVFSSRPYLSWPNVLLRWFSAHRKSVRPLLAESLLQDLAAIGTPYALMPILGVAQFGVYRALSNVNAPVRLVLNPIRAYMASYSAKSLRSWRVTAVQLTGAIVFGIGAFLALRLVEYFSIPLGTIAALAPQAAIVGVYILASFISTSSYFIARQIAPAKRLLLARLIQTGLATVLPILGALTFELSGAILGASIALLVSAVAWFLVLHCPPRGRASSNI